MLSNTALQFSMLKYKRFVDLRVVLDLLYNKLYKQIRNKAKQCRLVAMC